MTGAPELERRFVHDVYNAIAPHFSATRFAVWPAVAAFVAALPAGSLVLDAGCGNGKYLPPLLAAALVPVALDVCAPLAAIAAARSGADTLVADATRLPVRPAVFDAALSVAVLHHLSTPARRRAAINELVWALRPAGRALVTVWAREQEDPGKLAKWAPVVRPPRPANSLSPPLCRISEEEEEEGEEEQEYLVPWHVPFHRAEVGGVAMAAAEGRARRDDGKGTVVFERYYHVFKQGELERLVEEVAGAKIVDRFYDKSNWCVIIEKT